VPEPPALEPPALEPPALEPPALEPSGSEQPVPEQPPPMPETPPARVEPVSSGLPPLPAPVAPPGAVGNKAEARAPRSRRRSWIARLSALLALAAVVVAVVALLHAHNSKSTAPPAVPPVVKVLIPEGKTRAQIAQIASADKLKGNYRVASRSSPLLKPTSYGAPHDTPDLEGFLFPATYDMNPGAPVARLVQEQLVAFQENFGASEIARAHALHVTPYQLLIVASMVEREAQIPGDRPKIAAVIYNRLAAGMPLGIDASIYYAVELATGTATYTRELTEAQLHIDSPYNTRTHTGLPPTPISNPGVASIEAAAHPAHVSYLYYVAGADGCGEQVFSNTLAEFEAHAAAYKAAVAHDGGHPPTCKHTLTGTGK
jgi:cell division protein YceG involved in septum cleavage